jgi:hypothetical protein
VAGARLSDFIRQSKSWTDSYLGLSKTGIKQRSCITNPTVVQSKEITWPCEIITVSISGKQTEEILNTNHHSIQNWNPCHGTKLSFAFACPKCEEAIKYLRQAIYIKWVN